MSDLINILGNSNKDIDNQKLMDYLTNKLSAEDRHEVEKWMIDNDFVNDAVEGLRNVKKKEDLDFYVSQLNKQLHHYLQQKRQRREKKKLKDSTWIIMTVLLLLLLIVISYLVIQRAIS